MELLSLGFELIDGRLMIDFDGWEGIEMQPKYFTAFNVIRRFDGVFQVHGKIVADAWMVWGIPQPQTLPTRAASAAGSGS
jgi:hypothetical protein